MSGTFTKMWTRQDIERAGELMQERDALLVARGWIDPGQSSEFALSVQSCPAVCLAGDAAPAICEALDRQLAHAKRGCA